MQSAGLCGPQPPAAEARYSHSLIHAVSPQAAARIYYKDICGSSNRAVRRRPHAADCNSLYARLRPPPSANSPLPKPIILKETQITTKKARVLLLVSIICTTFGASDPSKRRESRCRYRKRGNLQKNGNKRMSRRVVTTLDW